MKKQGGKGYVSTCMDLNSRMIVIFSLCGGWEPDIERIWGGSAEWENHCLREGLHTWHMENMHSVGGYLVD